MPATRCSASATDLSGKAPMSVAVIESTTVSASFLICCEVFSERRTPTTTTSVLLASEAAAVVWSLVVWASAEPAIPAAITLSAMTEAPARSRDVPNDWVPKRFFMGSPSFLPACSGASGFVIGRVDVRPVFHGLMSDLTSLSFLLRRVPRRPFSLFNLLYRFCLIRPAGHFPDTS